MCDIHYYYTYSRDRELQLYDFDSMSTYFYMYDNDPDYYDVIFIIMLIKTEHSTYDTVVYVHIYI